MVKLLIVLLFAIGVAACNNGQRPAATNSDSSSSTNKALSTDSAARVAELSFIDGCVENSKLTLGETKAFAFCKCMYGQIHAKYPDMDSAQIAKMDTATINKLAESCR